MRKELLEAFGESTPKDSVKDLLQRSSQAVCGVMEREINVKTKNVSQVKSRLKDKGFFIVGTSEPNGNFRKIWFIRGGGF